MIDCYNPPLAMAAQKSKSGTAQDAKSRVICRNRRARHEYDILDELECGIALTGSEVKSARDHKVSIEEAYARVEGREVWLLGCDIAQYPQANLMNHEPRRPRKLLLKRREILKFAEAAGQSGLTLVPLDLHFSKGRIKMEIGLAKGKKQYDKREDEKKKDWEREKQRLMRVKA